MSRFYVRTLLCAAVPILALAGCAAIDPLQREGMWQPVGANNTNLRAMVAVPGDLVLGRAARHSDGNQAARAVARLRTDRVYPLPESSISKVGGSTAAPPPAGGDPQ